MFFYLIAFAAGIALASQAAINSQLSKAVGDQPVAAALISFFTGTLVLLAITLMKANVSEIWVNLPQQQWWKWTGGLMGAFLVCSSIIVAPKVGVANMLLFIILGQLLSGLLIDHYGFLGMPIKHIDWSKILGVGIVLIGMVVFFFGHKVVKA